MVENPSCNAGDAGLIPGQGTKIPHAVGQLSPHGTTKPMHHKYRAHALWSPRATTKTEARALQRKILHATTKT